jgi:hypothetical protein
MTNSIYAKGVKNLKNGIFDISKMKIKFLEFGVVYGATDTAHIVRFNDKVYYIE